MMEHSAEKTTGEHWSVAATLVPVAEKTGGEAVQGEGIYSDRKIKV